MTATIKGWLVGGAVLAALAAGAAKISASIDHSTTLAHQDAMYAQAQETGRQLDEKNRRDDEERRARLQRTEGLDWQDDRSDH